MRWLEFFSGISLKILTTQRRLKKHCTWHEWRQDHEIMMKKCCYHKREIKGKLQKEMAQNKPDESTSEPKKKQYWQVEISQDELRNLLRAEGMKKKSRNARKLARREGVLRNDRKKIGDHVCGSQTLNHKRCGAADG